MEKIKISKVIVVEGKYDKIKLSSIIDGLIIETDGFKIYKDKEKVSLIKSQAKKHGVIIVTDSDTAGFKIRSYLLSILKGCDIINLYTPQIKGKEKRKNKFSKEQLLGVEGIEKDKLVSLFTPFAEDKAKAKKDNKPVTKLDFFTDGLTGGKDSSAKRQALLKELDLPSYISANRLLELINRDYSYDEYKELIKKL